MKEAKKRLMTKAEYNKLVQRRIKGNKWKTPVEILVELINEIAGIEIVSEGQKKEKEK